MTRLLIAAPSAVVRAGLETLIASDPDIELAGSFPDLSSMETVRPDVVLAAVSLEDLTTPADGRPPAIVLLSADPQPSWTTDALRLGVRAVLPHDASAGEVLAAVGAASSGLAVLDPRDLEMLLAGSGNSQSSAEPVSGRASVLTPRELEVLRMMADGAANKNIAWNLHIS